jgi:hypothetical protein
MIQNYNIVDETKDNNETNFISYIKKYNIVRIGRELIWRSRKWNTDTLNQMLIDFSPEIIFFCAGDSGFAYNITKYIKKKFNTKLIIYITDDYILPRKTISLFWQLRRKYIFQKMKEILQQSNLFITISKEMRDTYKMLFGVDSILSMNLTETMKVEGKGLEKRDKISFVYAGGLHFRRYKTLNLLAKAIEKYNKETKGEKAFLEVYSGVEPNEKIKKYLYIKGASQYCGSLNQEELRIVLNQCNILVHVESFDNKCIESTKLSISTKIPEYLSLEKPVLAIGPKEVASMKYLEDCSYCITEKENIYTNLKKLIENKRQQLELSHEALMKFETNHNVERCINLLMTHIRNTYEKETLKT